MGALERLLTTRKVDGERLAAAGFGELTATAGLTWAQLLKRPEVGIEAILDAVLGSLREGPADSGDPLLADLAAAIHGNLVQGDHVATAVLRNEARAVETEIKFAGYLDQQRKSIEKLKAAEAVRIPDWMDYGAISGLSREMKEKLERVRPSTIGQASRMPGVTPAALSLVHVSIRLQGARRAAG
jgi:tRNA uridine 5-carboxymethylaminomethyl modification enzyme